MINIKIIKIQTKATIVSSIKTSQIIDKIRIMVTNSKTKIINEVAEGTLTNIKVVTKTKEANSSVVAAGIKTKINKIKPVP